MSATIATTSTTATSYAASWVAVSYGVSPTSTEGVVRASQICKKRRKDKRLLPQLRVVRRLRGLVLDNHGAEFLVGFEVNGELVEYELPAAQLRGNGITMRHQPFEMDEMKSTDPEIYGKVYRFRPLANAEEAYVEEIKLDPERQRLRNLIFASFGKAQD